ncbi:autotransporter domain-containing protein [Pandoraea sp. NPDC090278]|uniref:autotransporter domain-containing protein n=1 Tax=Pandoraea sp. NPDC090278 TaxID=3364391 RepID=UPI00383B9747
MNTAFISVGNGGTGILNITRGGAVSSGVVSIGAGGNGTVTVDGTGSSLTTAGSLIVGNSSTGILNVTNGGTVSNGAISIGTGGNGTVTVDGAGSSMSTSTPNGDVVVGGGSTGILQITNGGLVSGGKGYIGASGGTGTVTVDGSGSSWTTNGNELHVGDTSTGILNISNAGNVSAADVVLGNATTAAGSLNLKTGGVLQTGYVQKGPGSAAFTIDGGVLRPTGNQANFLQNFSAGDVSIASGGATIDTQGFTVGVSAAMGGTGGLIKTGTGTLTLAGANTYSGGTTITGGTVAISAANNLGTGQITLYGSTVQNMAAVTLANPVTLGSGGTFQTDADLTLSGAVNGAGSLTKQGSGTLTLAGANTYSGGTTITGGTVAISAANNLGTGQVTLDGSTLRNTAAVTLANPVTLGSGSTFQTDADLTLSGAVNGAGSLTKQGSGTLTLAGANTYSGGTTITGGTVAISAANNLGTGQVTLYGSTLQNTAAVTLTNPVTLGSGGTFQTDADLTLSNAVNGVGSLTKQGPGTLTIAGGNGWSGDTTLSGGTLTLDSYTQNSNQTLNINAASTSDVGKLKVNGTATFNAGANLVVNVANLKTVAVGQFFTGVISAGTLSASTFNVTANSALFNFKALLSGNTVNLAVVNASPTAVYDAVNAYGLRQARGAAQTLDAQLQTTPTGDMVNVVTALGKLSDQRDVARAAAQTLPMSTGSQALMNTLSSFNRIVSDRTAAGGTGLSTGDARADKRVWIKPFGSHAWQNDENGTAGFSANTWGMALGAETEWDTTRLGLAYAYANTRVSGNNALSGTSSDATVNSNVLALYGSRQVHGFDLGFQVDTGWNHSSSQRAISISSLNRTANGSYDTWSAHVGTGVSRPLPLPSDMTFIPEVRVDYTRLQSQSYTESGADALNLNVNANTVQALVFGVDGRLVKDLGSYGKINAHLGVGYDTINDPGNIVAAYAGVPGQSFLTTGLTHSPWLMTAGLGYDYRTAGGTNIALRYDVQARSGFVNQSASLKVSWRF